MNSYEKGNSTEAAVLAILLTRGIPVATPIGVRRYDLLVELDGRFQKAQIKTGQVVGGLLRFKVSTVHPVTGKRRPYTADEVDVFLVLNPATGKLYRVPFSLVGKTEFHLRLDPPKRLTVPRHRTIHYASKFEF